MAEKRRNYICPLSTAAECEIAISEQKLSVRIGNSRDNIMAG